MKSTFHRLLAEYPLETLLQTIPTGLFLVDTEYKVVYWNAEAERITGFNAAEAVGSHCSFLEGVPCNEKCGLFAEDIQKPVVGISCSVKHKNGQRIDLTKNVDLLRDENGKVIGGIEAFVDISRLVKLENQLRVEVENRTRELELEKAALRLVLDGMTDPVYICDANFRITFTNKAMLDIFGDVTGAICYQELHGRNTICDGCPISEVLSGNVVCQERNLLKTGKTYEIIHSPFPVAECPTHKLGVFRDITERKAAEKRLEQANRELDAFVSTVSHDLRSPLTPLIGFAELLEERSIEYLDDIGRESLLEIKATANKMKTLLEDLLTLARVGQLKNPLQTVDVTRVAEDVMLELADKVIERQAKINISPLPSIRVPESLLSDLFRNLLSNALKYAANKNPRIEIAGESFPDRVRYRVIDHGSGIPVNERDEVFEPFRRGSGSAGHQGTGIGLATVAKIARIYGGSAWVEETPGGGATFVVELLPPKD
ncbi:ATP-binding protein [Malonomonas rubra]|uniref:ATP-binding protein n=1 Tax=Malonomonas rubra TaxID=57040 RepID=UPI0026F0847A|nr:ATP-binding protein [Malonomonas rubra]